jgi:uncharacterized SAM-binding protein YcdF (DUF218 family)
LKPGNLFLLGLVAGILLGWRRRGGIGLLRLSTLALLAIAVLPIGPALLLPLEERFPPPKTLPRRIDGIIVLGGSVSPRLSKSYGETVFSGSPARLLAGIELARHYPNARLAILGGEGSLFPVGYAEARASLDFVEKEGIARARVLLEEASRSTHENALYGKKLLKPRPGQKWLLVTSAAHMPRAVASFRAQGWPVIPFPVDFKVDPATSFGPDFDLAGGLALSSLGAKEWVGLLAYRLFGWTDTLLAAPRPSS